MPHASPIFRPPKSRRLVSAWALRTEVDHLLAVADEYQDIIDQLVLMCDPVSPDGTLSLHWPARERAELIARLDRLGISVLNDHSGLRETWAALAGSPATIEVLIANMVRDCEETGADGVDLDFEHLSADNGTRRVEPHVFSRLRRDPDDLLGGWIGDLWGLQLSGPLDGARRRLRQQGQGRK